MTSTKIALFEGQKIRRIWNKKQEKWYFSVIDVVGVLTNSSIPKRYWSDLKRILRKEGSKVYEKIVQLKFMALDGKKYLSDSANTETLFRIIQSIPSKNAEPFKLWLAKVGYERIEEINNPEKALNRSRDYWKKMGRSAKWIQQRMMGQEIRNKLTDYWSGHKVTKQEEYAALTNIIHKEWSGLTVKGHKNLKGLTTHNLRDHMNDAELVFTALAELSTRQIAESNNAVGYNSNKGACVKGGRISKNARKELEKKTGKKVISSKNFLPKRTELE